MVTYEQLLAELFARRDETYRVFNERIVNVPPGSSIGVRTPLLRAYGRALVREEEFDLNALLSFPNDVYEVRLLKCFAVGYKKMPFSEKAAYIDRCLPVLDGWAVCDLFCSVLKEIKKHREEFFPQLSRYVGQGTEFSQRFAYVLLLGCYMDEAWLPAVFSLLDRARTEFYYTHMGAAWLLAEVFVKFFDRGVAYCGVTALSPKTCNKAIQKACESFRLRDEQKIFLKSLKKG